MDGKTLIGTGLKFSEAFENCRKESQAFERASPARSRRDEEATVREARHLQAGTRIRQGSEHLSSTHQNRAWTNLCV